jgi:hypothetical protein
MISSSYPDDASAKQESDKGNSGLEVDLVVIEGGRFYLKGGRENSPCMCGRVRSCMRTGTTKLQFRRHCPAAIGTFTASYLHAGGSAEGTLIIFSA